ncbi:MAG TPA: AsmA family protein [Bryobacteraceae bacterium]|nr:AsmA family protein [Bryobacteraceae bacterium]
MKARLILVSLVAVIVIVAVAVFAVGDVDRFRPKVQAELQQKLNRPVTIGHLGLKLLPLSIKVEKLTIGESPTFPTGKPFATAGEVFVSVGLFSLIRGNPEVKELTLDKPQIEIVRSASGVWNFSSLGAQSSSGQSQFTLAELKVSDGQLGFTDAFAKQARAVYDHIDATLSDFAPNQKFGVKIGVHFPGEGKQILAFKGDVGPLPWGTAAGALPVSGHLSLEEVSLSGVNRFIAGAIPAATDTVASGDADLKSEGDVIGCKGDLKLENTVIHGAKLDYPISAHYDVTADRKQNKLQVRSGQIELGSTTFNATGEVDAASTPANLNVQVSTKDSSITQLAQLAGAFGVAFDPAYKINGAITANLTAKGPTSAPQLNGSISAKGLEASGGEIKQTVSVPEIDLTLSPDRVISNNFTAKSGATALAMSFTLSQYATNNMNVDASLKTAGANIAELLNMAKAYGAGGARGVTGTGKLDLDVHVQGPVKDSSKLLYAGTGAIANAVISTPALTKPLTIASANMKFSQNSAGLDNLVAKLGSTTLRGNLATTSFTQPQLQFALSADQIDTAELQKLAAPANAAPAKPAGAKEPDLLLATSGSGTLAVGVLKAEDIVLKNVSTKCTLDHGVVQLSPLSADTFGGKASGSLTADMRPAVPQCSAQIKLAGADANAVLSSVSSVKNTLYGTLSADSNLRFALASSAALARTLNGVLSFNVANGELKNVNILGAVSTVSKFVNPGIAQGLGSATKLRKFAGTLNIVNGVATTNNLTAALDAGSLTASGSLNLVNQDVNMHTITKVESVGTIPILVTGNMSQPKVTPDVAALAKANASGIIGKALGQKSTGQNDNSVGGIIGNALQGLQNKKKKP